MDEYLPTREWHRTIGQGRALHTLLFSSATILPLLIMIWLAALIAIRWVNREPEQRRIRLLWLSLWGGGAGLFLMAITSLLMVRRQFFP